MQLEPLNAIHTTAFGRFDFWNRVKLNRVQEVELHQKGLSEMAWL